MWFITILLDMFLTGNNIAIIAQWYKCKKEVQEGMSTHIFVHLGKILEDDKLISEYNIDTVKNFVVVMAVKVSQIYILISCLFTIGRSCSDLFLD